MAISDNEFKLIMGKLDKMESDIDKLFSLLEKTTSNSLLASAEILAIKEKLVKYDIICDEHIELKTKVSMAERASWMAIGTAIGAFVMALLKIIFK